MLKPLLALLALAAALPAASQTAPSPADPLPGDWHDIPDDEMLVMTFADGRQVFIRLAALLSISLGIFNLIPIYPFDGGQMVMALAEMLRRGKRLSIRVQEAFQGVGFVALPVVWALGAVGVVMAAMAANRGEYFRYPATIRFIT